MAENGERRKTFSEEIAGIHLVERIKELIAEGNARAIRVRTEDGKIFLEIPLTAGAIGGGVMALAAPWLAILGALAALVTRVKVEIVHEPPNETPGDSDKAAAA
jgi:hypothetical protein